MQVIPFSAVQSSDWNSICDFSDDAWLFHRYEWILLETRRIQALNFSFAIFRDKKLIGIVPLLKSQLPLGPFVENLFHTGVHRHTGIAVSNALTVIERAEAEKFALSACISLAIEGTADRLQLSVQNAAPKWRPGSADSLPFWASTGKVNFGLYSGPNGITPFPYASTLALDQFYDLSVDPETRGIGISSTARTAARKAISYGIEIFVAESLDSLPMVLNQILKSAQRTGESTPDPLYFEELLNGECSRHITTLMARHPTRGVVGCLLISTYKNVTHFLHCYSDPESLKYRVNDLLHLRAIEWARAEKMDFYRLGPFFPEVPPDWPISKVSRFKTKFANTSVPIRQGSVFFQREKYIQLGLQVLTEMRDRGPSDL